MPDGVQLWETRPYKTITVEPIAGALGAVVGGVDLSKPLDDALFSEIYQAFVEHHVIFFRDQDMTPDQYLAFAKRWGDIHLHPFMKGLDSHPEILEIVKTETDTRAFGSTWHTDQMFCEMPAKCTMLYAKEVPAAGGDTMFANMYLAHDALSDGMKEILGTLKTYNVGDKLKSQGGKSRAERYNGKMSQMQTRDPGNLQTEHAHPIIRTHKDTGRKSIYFGAHTNNIDGLTDAESAPLMAFLREHTTRPEFTCRFGWDVGALAIWDNRCCQHYAVNDYAGQRRRMHRITILGEDKPF